MKSLLFTDTLPFGEVIGCDAGRQETEVALKQNGRIYRFVVRDKITVEDPYLIMVKAEAFALQQAEVYNAKPTPRDVKDFLIKSNVVI